MMANGRITFRIQNVIAKGFGTTLRARYFFNNKTPLNLYHGYIFPCLIYCVEIRGNAANIYIYLYTCISRHLN